MTRGGGSNNWKFGVTSFMDGPQVETPFYDVGGNLTVSGFTPGWVLP